MTEIKPHIRRGDKLYCACHDHLVMDLSTSIVLNLPEAGTNPDRFRRPPGRVKVVTHDRAVGLR